MKLNWFLFSLASIVMLSAPAKAAKLPQQPIDSSKAAVSDIKYNNYTNLIAENSSDLSLPGIKFTPPQPETIFSNPSDGSSFAGVLHLGREISPLHTRIQNLMNRYSYLEPGMFFLDLETGDYLDINGGKAFSAASTIKFPILVALFQEVDAGRIDLQETLVMRRDLVTDGSGEMQYKPVGSKLSVLETATKMMTISDNTATNMIIDRLGGKAKLNQSFQTWGLKNTVIRNLLVDGNGTNTTSAKDLVQLAALIANNKLISDRSHSQVFEIMRHCHNDSMLPAGLGKGAVIAHKTGTLRFVLADAGIIQTPSGKRYLAGIMVKRPNHDSRATDFIRQVSQIMYSHFDHAQITTLP